MFKLLLQHVARKRELVDDLFHHLRVCLEQNSFFQHAHDDFFPLDSPFHFHNLDDRRSKDVLSVDVGFVDCFCSLESVCSILLVSTRLFRD